MQTGESWAKLGLRAIFGAALVFATAALPTAFAATGGAAVPDFPSVVNVGDIFAGTLTITNTSDDVVHNAENVNVSNIFLTPSCQAGDGVCFPGSEDPNVFSVANGTGRTGTACAGFTFTAAVTNVTTGEVQFTPNNPVVLGPSLAGGLAAQCIIDFQVTALKLPSKDSRGDVAGLQTRQLARAALKGATSQQNGTGTGVDDTTVTAPVLAITKTPAASPIVSGDKATFTIVVTNNGTGAAYNTVVSDTLQSGGQGSSLTWTLDQVTPANANCSLVGTAPQVLTCTAFTLGAGQSQTLVVSALTNVNNCQTINNQATVTATNNATVPPASALINCVKRADLVISKTDGVITVPPNSITTYTVTVANNGPSEVLGGIVTDPVATGLTIGAWTCAVTNAGSGGVVTTKCGSASGSGPINTTVDMKVGAIITYTISATVTATSGTVVNLATVKPPVGTTNTGSSCSSSGGIVRNFNIDTGVCTSTDTDAVVPTVDLLVGKTDNVSTVALNTAVTYTVTVTNNGPSEMTGAAVTDPASSGLTIGAWTCAVTTPGSGGSVTTKCGATSGTGPLNTTVDMKAGAVITYTIAATVTASSGSVTNTANVTPPNGVINLGTNCISGGGIVRSFNAQTGTCSSSDTDTIPEVVTNVPTLTEYGLIGLMLMLATLGALYARRARR